MHRSHLLRTLVRPLIGATVATMLLGAAAAAGSPASFTDPVRITAGNYRTVDAAKDSDGRLHIAAQTTAGSIVYLTDRSGGFTKVTVAAGDPGDVVYRDPSIALDGNGRVHIVMVRAWDGGLDCGICSSGLMMVNDKGRPRGTFPAPTLISRSGAFAPDIRIHAGKVYIAFARGMDGLAPSEGSIWLRTNASGTWTTKRAANGLDGGFPTPSIVVNAQGRARIAYEDHGIRVAFAGTRTGGFSLDTVTGTNGTATLPVIRLNASGAPVVIYQQDRAGTADDGVYLRGKAGAGWTGVKVSPRLGFADMVIEASQVTVAVGVPTDAGAGTYAYPGPSYPEEQVADTKVRGLSLASASDILYSTPVLPRGIHLAQD